MTTFEIEAFAKINLTLAVYPRRADGYHELKSVVQPISLADTLVFEAAETFSTDTGYPDDLILKAANTLVREVKVRGEGEERSLVSYHVRVTKRIPAGGGLGGGSADAAATLRALNELWKLGLTPEQLAEIGAAVGSDVPALVLAQHYRVPALMEGRGEKVSLLSQASELHLAPSPFLILANPRVHSSTKDVYDAYDTYGEEDFSVVSRRPNYLEAPAIRLYPAIGVALDDLRCAGARDVQMSGSGSTVFGFATDLDHARAVSSALAKLGRYDIILCKTL